MLCWEVLNDLTIELRETTITNFSVQMDLLKNTYTPLITLTTIGITALVMMEMLSLKLLEFSSSYKYGLSKAQVAVLMHLKPHHLHLIIRGIN